MNRPEDQPQNRGEQSEQLTLPNRLPSEVSPLPDDGKPTEREPTEEELRELEDEDDTELPSDTDDIKEVQAEENDPVGLYLKEIGKIPLLKPTEVVILAKRIENGKTAAEKMLRSNQYTLKQRNKFRRDIKDGRAARTELTKHNLRLVIPVAKRYMDWGVNFLDLIQEGNTGLMRAAEDFDYHRGVAFSTYATWWIKNKIRRAVYEQAFPIRIPIRKGEEIFKMRRVERQLTQELGREPKAEELADRLGVTVKKIVRLQQIAQDPISFDEPVGEGESVVGDFIEDEKTESPHDHAYLQMLHDALEEAFKTMPEQEVKVLKLRFEFDNNKHHTLEEVGREMGVTRERIRQIQGKALRRLRNPKRGSRLYDFSQKKRETTFLEDAGQKRILPVKSTLVEIPARHHHRGGRYDARRQLSDIIFPPTSQTVGPEMRKLVSDKLHKMLPDIPKDEADVLFLYYGSEWFLPLSRYEIAQHIVCKLSDVSDDMESGIQHLRARYFQQFPLPEPQSTL